MNTTKPTPGPWHWDADEYGYGTDGVKRWRYRVTALGRTIMQTYYTEAERGQAEADTKLAASAHDLLEALDLARRHIREHDDHVGDCDLSQSDGDNECSCDYGLLLTQIDAAIKRATGATP